jgi:hypothetical protein
VRKSISVHGSELLKMQKKLPMQLQKKMQILEENPALEPLCF